MSLPLAEIDRLAAHTPHNTTARKHSAPVAAPAIVTGAGASVIAEGSCPARHPIDRCPSDANRSTATATAAAGRLWSAAGIVSPRSIHRPCEQPFVGRRHGMGGKGGGRGGVVVWPVVRSDGQRGHRHPLGYCHPLGRMGRPLPPRETPYSASATLVLRLRLPPSASSATGPC